MNDLHKLTKIIFIGLAVYILITAAMSLFVMLAYVVVPNSGISFGLSTLAPMTFAVIYACVIIYLLVYKGDFWVQKIVGPEDQASRSQKVFWLPVAFRLVSVFAGIFYLYWAITSTIRTISAYAIASRQGVIGEPAFLPWSRILSWIILLALGVYLLYGAPHFVRWQVKKTLEQCRQSDELQEKAIP